MKMRKISTFKPSSLPSAVPILIFLCITFTATADYFFTAENFRNIILNGSVLSIIALGMSLVMLTNGIDLSVGGTISFVSIITAILLANRFSTPCSIILSLLAGCIIGLINGLLVAVFQFPSFFVTLGTMGVMNSLALVLSDGRTVYWDASWLNVIASEEILSLPIAFWVILILLSLTIWFFHFHSFGTYVWGIGNNEEALRLVGVNTKLYKIIVYVLCSVLASISGIITTSRIASGHPTIGFGTEFQAIAAAAIGGIAFFGGHGHPGFTIVSGTAIMVLVNGLNLMGFSTPWQYTATGLLLIIGMSTNILNRTGRA